MICFKQFKDVAEKVPEDDNFIPLIKQINVLASELQQLMINKLIDKKVKTNAVRQDIQAMCSLPNAQSALNKVIEERIAIMEETLKTFFYLEHSNKSGSGLETYNIIDVFCKRNIIDNDTSIIYAYGEEAIAYLMVSLNENVDMVNMIAEKTSGNAQPHILTMLELVKSCIIKSIVIYVDSESHSQYGAQYKLTKIEYFAHPTLSNESIGYFVVELNNFQTKVFTLLDSKCKEKISEIKAIFFSCLLNRSLKLLIDCKYFD